MTLQLSAAEARRMFLDAQGLARRTPSRRPRMADFDAYLRRQGVLQLDTVNVLARAHYLPLYSRLGAYRPADLDDYLWGDARGHSAHAFEHWGHEASVMPRSLLPYLHHRMANDSTWKSRTRDQLDEERPGLLAAVRAAVEENGPVVAGDLDHLAPRDRERGTWWDHGHVKVALEYLFITGAVAASRGRHFARTYDAASRGWGREPADVGDWGTPAADAHQALFDHAITATAVGSVRDLCDHFRLPYGAGARSAGGAGGEVWAASAVERGIAEWAEVEGWGVPALVAAGARDPGRATGRALLSPFDPVCWYRPRLLRMFGVDYRIEIYTPAHKRVFGYYCLPMLVGDQIVARLDLKADRKAGVLLVQAAWHEPGRAPGARRIPSGAVAEAASAELDAMAAWLGLDTWTVAGMGDLAPAL